MKILKSTVFWSITVCLSLAPLAGGDAIAQTGREATISSLNGSLVELSSNVSSSVVQIIATGYGPVYSYGPGSGIFRKQQSGGSGAIVDSSGYIVTNAHVVAGAKRIRVVLPIESAKGSPSRSILPSEGKVVGATLVGMDLETDLAVLKIQSAGLPYLEFADSDELQPGAIVLAFGSPLGLENSVSLGIVSAVGRQLSEEDPMIYIQTDAPINPGNSGGPLINSNGRLVGINTLIFSQSGGNEGIGFAAPSNIVRTVYEQIRESGYVRRGEIGVHAQTISPLMAEAMELDRNWGVIVGDVAPDSPAEKTGLKIGDIILSLGGKIVENGRQFNINLYRLAVGESAQIEIIRDGIRSVINVPVVERPDDPERFANLVSSEQNLVAKLGILGIEIDREIRRLLGTVRKPSGVLVAALSGDAVLWGDRLRPGDIVYNLNAAEIGNLSDLREAASGLEEGDPVVIQIERNGHMRYLAFEVQ